MMAHCSALGISLSALGIEMALERRGRRAYIIYKQPQASASSDKKHVNRKSKTSRRRKKISAPGRGIEGTQQGQLSSREKRGATSVVCVLSTPRSRSRSRPLPQRSRPSHLSGQWLIPLPAGTASAISILRSRPAPLLPILQPRLVAAAPKTLLLPQRA